MASIVTSLIMKNITQYIIMSFQIWLFPQWRSLLGTDREIIVGLHVRCIYSRMKRPEAVPILETSLTRVWFMTMHSAVMQPWSLAYCVQVCSRANALELKLNITQNGEGRPWAVTLLTKRAGARAGVSRSMQRQPSRRQREYASRDDSLENWSPVR